MASPLTPLEKERARAWMKAQRGDTSQAALVDDIQRTTGWSITRDRYSKYESGGTDFGRGVLEKFIAYWTKKERSGPDLTPPAPVQPPVDLADALMAIAKSNDALTAELRAAREERAAVALRLDVMDGILKRLVEQAKPGSAGPHALQETTGSK